MDLQRLERYVLLREESTEVDLKWEQCLHSKRSRIEFATDVASLANSESVSDDPNGYLILGLPDISAQSLPSPSKDCAPFGDRDEERSFNHTIQQTVDLYCDPPVHVEYRECHIAGHLVGLLTVFPAPVLPVFIHNTGSVNHEWVVWVRSGRRHPRKRHAKGSEIRRFFLDYLRTLNPYMTDQDWGQHEDRVRRLTPQVDRTAFLATELVQTHVDRRALACRALGEITGLDDNARTLAGQLLIGCLHDEELSVRWEAIRALAQLKDERAIPALRILCRDSSPELALEAIGAIQTIGGGMAVAALRSIFGQESDDEVREYTRTALVELTGAEIGEQSQMENVRREGETWLSGFPATSAIGT